MNRLLIALISMAAAFVPQVALAQAKASPALVAQLEGLKGDCTLHRDSIRAASGEISGLGFGNTVATFTLESCGGGNNAGSHLAVFDVRRTLVDRLELRGFVEWLKLADGVVELSTLVLGPDDARCCPTLKKSLSFVVDKKSRKLSVAPGTAGSKVAAAASSTPTASNAPAQPSATIAKVLAATISCRGEGIDPATHHEALTAEGTIEARAYSIEGKRSEYKLKSPAAIGNGIVVTHVVLAGHEASGYHEVGLTIAQDASQAATALRANGWQPNAVNKVKNKGYTLKFQRLLVPSRNVKGSSNWSCMFDEGA